MGAGDVKLMAAVGILLGYKGVLLAAFFGIVIGSVAAVILKIKNLKGWKSEIAFGPYLCIGTYISMLFGERFRIVYTSDTLYITVQNFTDNGATLSVVSISVYDEDGNIVVTVDPLGGVTRYTYDSDGNLTAETDPLGTTLDYTYIDGKVSSFGVSGLAQIAYIYNGDKLTSVLSGLASQQGYTFEYDDFGNITRIKAGNYTLVTYAYDSLSGNLTSVIYGNGCTVGYSYDNLDRINKISYNGSARYTFAYTKEHELYRTEDLLNGETIMALDDPLHSCTIRMNTATSELQELSYSFYNAEEQLITQRTHILLNGEWTTQEYGYNYDVDTGKLTSLEIGNHTIEYEYDLLGRKVSENNSSYGKTYTYRNVLGKTCDLVDTITYTKSNGINLVTYSYEYDAKGNITKVYKNGILYNQYAYDALGQLVREDNRDANRSYTYEYDSRGNFVAKHEHSFSTGALSSPLGNGPVNYTYYTDSWKDRLKTYNGNDTITYDSIGNPLFYDNGSEYAFTWEGRQMQSATKGSQTYSYTYNADGLRTSKTVGNAIYHYYWNGGKLTAMTYGDHRMTFTYTENGTPYSVTCYDAFLDKEYECLYITNLQGDVVGIYDPEISSMVVSYTYDAWGRILSISGTSSDYAQLEMNNPLRYRGYCYDDETGLYYVSSRYYDPEVGRFISADEATYLGASGTNLGYNLFAYCENNPVINIDPDGHLVITTTMLICAGIGALVLGTIGGIGGYHLSKKWKVPKGKRWKYVLGGVVIGAVVGALIGGAVGYVIGPSASSGIVLWSGNGNASVFQAAKSFAKKNGLRVLEKTRKGKILTKMQNKLIKEQGKDAAWKIMKPLFDAASEQFARSANGTVHIFLNASGIRFESTFLTVEYWILREMGINMVFHFID